MKRFITLLPTCKINKILKKNGLLTFFDSYCCGAGTAADTEFTTNLISSQIELHSLSTGRKPRVVTAMTLLKQMLYK